MQKDPNFVMRERKRMRGGGRPLEDGGLEEKLVEFFKACMEDQHPLITTLLRVEALSIDESWCGGLVNPNFIHTSSSWISRFLIRNKLTHPRSYTGWSEATINIRTYLESAQQQNL